MVSEFFKFASRSDSSVGDGDEDGHLLAALPLRREAECRRRRGLRARPALPSDHLEQNAPEARAQETVDDKVGARVNSEEEVTDPIDIQQLFPGEVRVVWPDGVDALPDAQKIVWGGAQDEDNHDDDQSEAVARHLAVPMVVPQVRGARHLLSLLVRFLYRLYELRVEERQTCERHKEAHEEIAQRFVGHHVNAIVPQLGFDRVRHGVVVGVQLVINCSLPEARQIVENGKYEDEHNRFAHARHG